MLFTINGATSFLHTAKGFIPNRVVTVRTGDKPWYCSHLRLLRRKKERAHSKAKLSNSQNHWANYRVIRNEYCIKIKQAKLDYMTNISNTVESCGSTTGKQFWKFAKSILGKSADCSIPALKIGEDIYTCSKDKAEQFNKYFVDKCNIDDSLSTAPTTLNKYTDSVLSSLVVSEQAVFDVLLSLDITKASGPDKINPRLLKEGARELAPSLVRLFNISVTSCQIPAIWKLAHVIPIFKKGDRSRVSNYRPVSLLSVVCKCLERIIFKQVFNFFVDNNITTKWQSGFVPGDSAIQQLVSICHFFAETLDSKKAIRCVFCDISSAFDRVWHRGLLYKLECAGICHPLLPWFENYLSKRSQQVVIQGESSFCQAINAGVPQGSVLGPLLFLVFINDLPENLESHVRLFADDSTLFVTAANSLGAATTLNNDLASINLWAKKWLVKFNPDKTESLFISTNPNAPPQPPIYFDGQIVKEVSANKHLGVTISSNLTWNKHIEDVCTKALRRLDILRFLKYKLSRRSLELIYLSYIRPLLEYGDILYDGCGVANSIKLNKVQYEAAKIVSGATHGTSTILLLQDLGWEFFKFKKGKTQTLSLL